MAFNSVQYLLFLILIVALYWAVPLRHRPAVLLGASLVFYGYRAWWYNLLLLFAITVAFFTARALPGMDATRKKWAVRVAITSQIGVLGLFKSLGALSFADGGVSGVLLPAGLSFYTFQAVSYLIDVRRGDYEPEQNFVVFAAFVSFFPHLLAGPIVRARRLIPQIVNGRAGLKKRQASEGLELILVGLFKKVAIADFVLGVTRDYQPRLLANDGTDPFVLIIVIIMLVLLGGYFDIAGYIDIARGSSKLLGIELPHHFAQPLTRSKNFTDFWRRWQTTLMAFLRDYLFSAVRGTRSKRGRRVSIGVTVVFLAVSLWHGLNIGFLLFGLTVSGLMYTERRVTQFCVKRRKPGRDSTAKRRAKRVGGIIWVWICLVLTQVVLVTGGQLGDVSRIFRIAAIDLRPIDFSLAVTVVFAFTMLVVLDRFERAQTAREGFPAPVTWVRAVGFAAMALGILIASGSTAQDFVYTAF